MRAIAICEPAEMAKPALVFCRDTRRWGPLAMDDDVGLRFSIVEETEGSANVSRLKPRAVGPQGPRVGLMLCGQCDSLFASLFLCLVVLAHLGEGDLAGEGETLGRYTASTLLTSTLLNRLTPRSRVASGLSPNMIWQRPLKGGAHSRAVKLSCWSSLALVRHAAE